MLSLEQTLLLRISLLALDEGQGSSLFPKSNTKQDTLGRSIEFVKLEGLVLRGMAAKRAGSPAYDEFTL